MRRYNAPAIEPPIPYPRVINPKTAATFTASELVSVHRLLRDELLATALRVVLQETDCEIPDFLAIYQQLEETASLCLFDALEVRNAGGKMTF